MSFLLMILAGASAIALVYCLFMCAKWLKDYLTKRLKGRNSQKVNTAFVDTKEVVDDYLKEKSESANEISMSGLESLVDKTPYVAVDINKSSGELSNLEGMCPIQGTDGNFSANMKKHQGILVF